VSVGDEADSARVVLESGVVKARPAQDGAPTLSLPGRGCHRSRARKEGEAVVSGTQVGAARWSGVASTLCASTCIAAPSRSWQPCDAKYSLRLENGRCITCQN
jgi:hypothetical protein